MASRNHQLDALQAQLEETGDAVKLQVKRSWLNLQVNLANISTAAGAKAQAEENFRLTRLQYQQSLATSGEVLDARALLSQAEANSYNAIYGCMSARAELARAVGRDLPLLSPAAPAGETGALDHAAGPMAQPVPPTPTN